MIQQLVRQFHETFGAPIDGSLNDRNTNVLRVRLIEEELQELEDAIFSGSKLAVADALGDLAYVVYGAAVAYGIDLDAIVQEIHRSNMTKLMPDGTVAYREDGKVLKGPSFEQPNLAPILGSVVMTPRIICTFSYTGRRFLVVDFHDADGLVVVHDTPYIWRQPGDLNGIPHINTP